MKQSEMSSETRAVILIEKALAGLTLAQERRVIAMFHSRCYGPDPEVGEVIEFSPVIASGVGEK